MKKIFFITGAVPPQTGGEFYNYKVAKHLSAVGYDTECISLHQRLAVRLAWIPFVGEILANVALAYLLTRCDGILVEDHYFTKYLFLTNIIHKFIKQEKLIVFVHSLYGYDTSDNIFIRKWFNAIRHKIRLSFADLVITNSEYSKREIVSLGIKPLLIHVIPPGIDIERCKIIQEQTDSSRILTVANYLPGKGLIYLIDAFAQIKRKEFTLHLVGNPHKKSSYYQKLKKHVEKLDLTKNVIFHNGSERETIQKLYSNANIFVLPTLKETFGIVLIEAMHYGLPIITTNVGAIPELVTHGENGLLVKPANAQELASSLSSLIEDIELRKEMGVRGKKRVANSYSWEQTYSKCQLIIESMSS